MYNSIIEAVIANCGNDPQKTAVADMTHAYSYKELLDLSYQTAERLSSVPLGKGSHIIVECTQDVRYIIIDMACELCGIVFVPTEKGSSLDRVRDIYAGTGAQCIISRTDYSSVGKCCSIDDIFAAPAERADGGAREKYVLPESESTAEILFTTGTTGQPKGIVISHRANVAVAENICGGVCMPQNGVELVPLPLSHSHGLRTCYANLLNGSTVVILDGIMNVGSFFGLIDKYNVNALDMTPTMAKLLVKIARSGLEKISDRIEYIEIGTAFLDDEIKASMKELFPKARLYNFYGSTEAGRSCVLDFNKFDESGCIGYPSKNSTFYIVDDDKNPIESSKENCGLVAVSGSMLMDGYLNSEELTKSTVIDGILYTSDMGYIDEEGRIYVIGRKDNVITYKGIKIAPEEIETVAIKFSGIADCACVPLKDSVCGQVPKLFVQISQPDSFNKQEFMKFLKSNLESSRMPTVIEVIDEIPRSSNGKILRKELMK